MTDRSTAPARRRRPFRRPAGRRARTFAALAALMLPGCAALDPKPVTYRGEAMSSADFAGYLPDAE